jgi:cyclopropane-fatty-acyl-phospholipid synthase
MVRSRTRHPFFRGIVLRALSGMRRGRLLLELPDGSAVTLGGSAEAVGPFGGTARIRVLSERFFQRCVFFGDIGLAESFLQGEWESDDLFSVIAWFVANASDSPSQSASRRHFGFVELLGAANRLLHRLRSNSLRGSRRNIAAHYDLSNDFFALFLDETMTYSAARFDSGDESLEKAQLQKYEALCRMLRLRSSDRLLEIGGGWGGFSRYAAREYGCHVTTTTISSAQFDHAAQRIQQEGVGDRVTLLQRDYRELGGNFDKIVSIEMLEAVGHEYLDTYFAKCDELLAPQGLLALQVITCPDSRYDRLRKGVDFVQKYVFPGSLLPSLGAISASMKRTGDLMLHQLDDLGASYAQTLHHWRERFGQRLDEVRTLGFDNRFLRLWDYYLAYCEAAFAMRHISVVQALYTRPNNYSL